MTGGRQSLARGRNDADWNVKYPLRFRYKVCERRPREASSRSGGGPSTPTMSSRLGDRDVASPTTSGRSPWRPATQAGCENIVEGRRKPNLLSRGAKEVCTIDGQPAFEMMGLVERLPR